MNLCNYKPPHIFLPYFCLRFSSSIWTLNKWLRSIFFSSRCSANCFLYCEQLACRSFHSHPRVFHNTVSTSPSSNIYEMSFWADDIILQSFPVPYTIPTKEQMHTHTQSKGINIIQKLASLFHCNTIQILCCYIALESLVIDFDRPSKINQLYCSRYPIPFIHNNPIVRLYITVNLRRLPGKSFLGVELFRGGIGRLEEAGDIKAAVSSLVEVVSSREVDALVSDMFIV